ncbi:MAG TPA: hypothetical protein VF062_03000 [Candidatus Limnocylindrales bacterium]
MLARFAIATIILALVSGCVSPRPLPTPVDPPSGLTGKPTPSPVLTGAGALTVTITKTGGIAGVNDTLTIDPQGSYTRTSRTGKRTGRLTPDQLATLATLATDPRLLAEATTPQSPSNCADAFQYTVQVGPTAVRYTDCGAETPPATAALVQFLEQATSY